MRVRSALSGRGSGQVVETALGDGSDGAPGNSAQLPALLDGFAARPAWQVAGVDYGVGITPGTSLKTPTSGNIPAGCSLSSGVLRLANGSTLDAYDLSGLTVLIQAGVTGTLTLSNCSSTSVNIRSEVDVAPETHLIIRNCELDGGGENMDPDFQTIKVWCRVTMEYSWVKHGPAAVYSPAIIARYNLFQGFGLTPEGGGHCNAIYSTGGGGLPVIIEYNTFWTEDTRTAEGFPIGLGASVALFGDGGGYPDNTTITHNTQVSSLDGGVSIFFGYYLGGDEVATGGIVTDNYMGTSGDGDAIGFFTEDGTVSATYARNINMNTGETVSI